jgi:hypothetical protein
MTRRTLPVPIAFALALLLVRVPDAASAKKNKGQITATVNGKTVKARKNASITVGGGTVAFFVIAQTRPKPLLRTLSVACGQFPPPAVPGPGAFCVTSYQEMKIGPKPVIRAWTDHVGDTQLTFESYDGQTVSGHFSADLTSLTGLPPVHIDAEFSGPTRSAQ